MKTDNEKYNEKVKPNSAFLAELRTKLPEFFTKDGSFDLDRFRNQLKNKNVNELSEGYQLNFIGKDYARRQAGEMPSTIIVPDEKQNQGEGKTVIICSLLVIIWRSYVICRLLILIRLT